MFRGDALSEKVSSPLQGWPGEASEQTGEPVTTNPTFTQQNTNPSEEEEEEKHSYLDVVGHGGDTGGNERGEKKRENLISRRPPLQPVRLIELVKLRHVGHAPLQI